MTLSKNNEIFTKISEEDVKNKLIEIFGAPNVSDKQVDLYPYSYDMTEIEAKMPNFVVIPENVDQLVKLVKFCNSNLIPIVPYITGNNVGGLTIPEKGGIIVDFGKKMNKILHINDNMMYALLEPGVTFGQLKKYLDDNYPHLRYSYPFAPPYAGVVGNALLSGMNNMSCKIGSMGDSVNGLEVITAEGDIARIGSCFYGIDEADPDSWWSRYPMPDLMGLFINWQGMSGIVTKCAVQLWPQPEFQKGWVSICFEAEDLASVLREVGKTETVEDISVFGIQAIKLVVGIENPELLEGEPKYCTVMPMTAKTQYLLDAKERYLRETIAKLNKEGKKIKLIDIEEFSKLFSLRVRCAYDLPSVILPTVNFSGLTWFGTYAPTHKFEVLFKRLEEIFKKSGHHSPIVYGKIMKYSHYGIFRPILPYNKFKEEDKIKEVLEEIVEMGLEEGCIPYKTPKWVTEKMLEKVNPGWKKLFEKVKNVMDPNDIFNPGRFEV